MFSDRSVWTQHLKRIYINVIEAVIKEKQNSRLAQNYLLSVEMTKLGAETLYQLDVSPGNDKTADVTQIAVLDITQESPAKRARLSVDDKQTSVFGLELLVMELTRNHEIDEMKIPWLQLLSEMISKHIEVTRNREDQLMRLMCQLISNTNVSSVRELVCQVLEHMCHVTRYRGGTFVVTQLMWSTSGNLQLTLL